MPFVIFFAGAFANQTRVTSVIHFLIVQSNLVTMAPLVPGLAAVLTRCCCMANLLTPAAAFCRYSQVSLK